VNDQNVSKIFSSFSSSSNRKINGDKKENEAEKYSYNISFNFAGKGKSRTDTISEEGVTEVDLNAAKKGYMLFRLVHPVNESKALLEYSSPVTHHHGFFGIKDKKN
jgi:hypothetical protein